MSTKSKHFSPSNKAFTPVSKAVVTAPKQYTGSNDLVVCNGAVMSKSDYKAMINERF